MCVTRLPMQAAPRETSEHSTVRAPQRATVITLTVVSFNDAPLGGALTARFDEQGGTIGRADSNHLVLPDPERTISRVAAQLVFADGRYSIVDRGSNPITVNGKSLGSSRKALLNAGDLVRVGGYVMQVAAAAPPTLATLSEPAYRGAAASPVETQAGDAAAVNWDPFAQPSNWGNMQPRQTAGGIKRAGIQRESGRVAPLAVVDHTRDSALAATAATAANEERGGHAVAPPELPTASRRAVVSWELGARPLSRDTTLGQLGGPISAAESKPQWPPQGLASVAEPSSKPTAKHATAPGMEPAADALVPHQPVPRTVPTGFQRPDGRPPDHALLAAFLQGLDVKDSPITALTPEFMRLVGSLLRESVGGAVDLLIARAAMKRELRASATTIVARDNNPLKFSPTAEAALAHILSPPVRGFMPGVEAMRDAFDDLHAHQFAFVAGMQAALEGVLERFDPQALEGQLSRSSVLSALLPGGRKGKMWDVFVDHYTHIREQASEDFHTLFGEAFLKAYDEQLEQLQPSTTQPGVKRER